MPQRSGLKTRGMALGAVLRVVAIYLAARVAHGTGLLNHRSAAAILVLRFLAEALVVLVFLRVNAKIPGRAAPP